jgi:phosphosulfolactate synthase (CoM biosynthesis protein A)
LFKENGYVVCLQDIFESMGDCVDGLKFCGGSDSLMSKDFIKQVIDTAHQHDVYVSTGDWAEHMIHHKGPSGFKDYVEVCSHHLCSYFEGIFLFLLFREG